MKKVARLGYVEEEPDEILGEKPYLHCLGHGGKTDQMDEMQDVVANATAATAELLLAPPRAVNGACPRRVVRAGDRRAAARRGQAARRL